MLLWLARQCAMKLRESQSQGSRRQEEEGVMGAWDAFVGRDEELGSPHTRRFVRLGPSARVPTAQVGWTFQREERKNGC